jgi:hypothetical protein
MNKAKYFLRNITPGLLILLFLYTGLHKLIYPQKFMFSLVQSPILPAGILKCLAILVPTIELALAALLLSKKTRNTGLVLSGLLLLVFSVYIIAILKVGGRIPCSCGGIIESLNWTQHLFVNLTLAALSVASYGASGNLLKPGQGGKAALLLALLCCSLCGTAQKKEKTVRVLEAGSRLPIEGCFVKVTDKADTLKGFTNERGLFSIPGKAVDSLRFGISSKIFFTLDTVIQMLPGKDTILLLLRPKVKTLEAATVAGNRITTGLNTITYRIPAKQVQEYTLAKGFIAKVPAVTRMGTDYVVDGSKPVIFSLNGVPISKEQAENMPASIIEKIVLKTASDNIESREAVIDIILKKNLPAFAKNIFEGSAGVLYEAYSIDNNFLLKSKRLLMEAGLNGYTNNNTGNTSYLKKAVLNDTSLYTLSENRDRNSSLIPSILTIYNPDSNNQVTAYIASQFTGNRPSAYFTSFAPFKPLQNISSNTEGAATSGDASIYWSRKLSKRKTLNISAAYHVNKSDVEYATIHIQNTDASNIVDDRYKARYWFLNCNYSISKKRENDRYSIWVGSSCVFRRSANENRFYEADANGTAIWPPAQTTSTKLSQNRFNPGAGFSYTKKKLTFSGNLWLELFKESFMSPARDTSILTARLLPRISASYAFSGSLDIGVNMYRSIKRPDIQTVAARRYGSNPYLQREGNPSLKPQSIFFTEAYLNKNFGHYFLRVVMNCNAVANATIARQFAVNDSLSIIQSINVNTTKAGFTASLSGDIDDYQNISLSAGGDYYRFAKASQFRNNWRWLLLGNYTWQRKKMQASFDLYYRSADFAFNTRTVNYADCSMNIEYQATNYLTLVFWAGALFDNWSRSKSMNFASASYLEKTSNYAQTRNIQIGIKLNVGKKIYNDRPAKVENGGRTDQGASGL